jgi:hypothetical protein
MSGLDILLIIVVPIIGLFSLAYFLDKRRLSRKRGGNPPVNPVLILFMLIATVLILLFIGYYIISNGLRGIQNPDEFAGFIAGFFVVIYLLGRSLVQAYRRNRSG